MTSQTPRTTQSSFSTPSQTTQSSQPSYEAGRHGTQVPVARVRGMVPLTKRMRREFSFDDDGDPNTTMHCNHCRKSYKYNTTKMRSHLISHHPERSGFIARFDQVGQLPAHEGDHSSIPQLSMVEERALEHQMDQYCLDVVIKGGKPLNFWDRDQNPQLYDFEIFKARRMGLTTWTPPSRFTVARGIDKYHEVDKQEVKKIVQGESRLHFSFDGSKDPADHRVLNASLAIPNLGNAYLENINMTTQK
jgi:hypothetical protein